MTFESIEPQKIEDRATIEQEISSNEFVAKADELWASINEDEIRDGMIWSKLDDDSKGLAEEAAVELSELLQLRRTALFEAQKKAGPGGTINEEADATIKRINNIIDKGLSKPQVQPALISYCDNEIKVIQRELAEEKLKRGGQLGERSKREHHLEDELKRAVSFREFVESKQTTAISS